MQGSVPRIVAVGLLPTTRAGSIRRSHGEWWRLLGILPLGRGRALPPPRKRGPDPPPPRYSTHVWGLKAIVELRGHVEEIAHGFLMAWRLESKSTTIAGQGLGRWAFKFFSLRSV